MRASSVKALRSRLEKQPTDLRRDSRDFGDGTLARNARLLFTAGDFCVLG
jgi:hypothetical protein